MTAGPEDQKVEKVTDSPAGARITLLEAILLAVDGAMFETTVALLF